MKKLHKKMYKFGAFYAKNWKILILVKVVIIAGVLSTIFISSDHNGRVSQNIPSAFASVRPKPSCGDGMCLGTDAYCSLSSFDCSKIKTSSCSTITGCELGTTDVYACGGTNFNCAGASVMGESTCINLGCFWSGSTCSNDDGMGKTTNESCSSLVSATSCSLGGGAIGGCSWEKSGTTDICAGTISVPDNVVSCAILDGIIKVFGATFTAQWYEAYVENSNSCALDCGEDLCGNGTCDEIAGSCELFKTDCSNIGNNASLCSKISGCSASTGTSYSYSCSGTTFSCAALTNESACNSVNCAWDKGSSSCSVFLDEKGNPKTIETCANLNNQIACEYVANNGGADCVWVGEEFDVNVCEGDINESELSEENCLSLGKIGATWTSGYVEDSNSCPDDCGVQTDDCVGIPVENCGTYATKEVMENGGDSCTDYYSTSEEAQCVKNADGKCGVSTACTVATICGNGEVEEDEACDDGNSKDTDACSNACVAQDYIVPYTPDGSITGVQGEGVYYDSKNNGFFVPKEITIFVFTDGNTLIGFSNGSFFFLVSYTPVGDINNISPKDSVNWASQYNFFVMNYSGSMTPPVSEFTFTDNGISMTATYDGSSWDFAEDDTPTCVGAPITDCELLDYLYDPSTQCELYYNSKSILQCAYDAKSGGCTEGVACSIATVCGNGKKESGEACDDGNVKDGDGCSSTCEIESNYCGNGIVDRKETCDNGINNGKVGQCNASCNGRTVYNNSCGDGMCSSYCTLPESMTCRSFNKNSDTKALCSTVGCFLQITNNYDCAGTVACEKITKSTMYNDQYMVRKYCNLAGCSYDDKSGLCSTPAKAPSCSNLPAAEYCKMLSPMGCTLTVDGTSSSCVGDTAIRADKLDSNQCDTLDGTWKVEDENTCNEDCKPTCNTTSAGSCDGLDQERCGVAYANGYNCVFGKGSCTKGSACSTCGNNVCDKDESYTTCSNDCPKSLDWPSVSYSPRKPKDGSRVTGPVTATVSYGDDCSIVNNGKSTNIFRYNGYYVFKVFCPSLSDKILNMGAKVSWINDPIMEVANLNDFSNTSGSTLYCENSNSVIGEIDPNNTTMLDLSKKAIYEQSLLASDEGLKAEVNDKVTISGNLYFSRGASTLTKIELEKALVNGAKKASVIIPEGVKVIVADDNGKTSDFEGVFLAPTTASYEVKNKLSQQVENIENNVVASVVKFGDVDNKKLTLVTSGDVAEQFIITMKLDGYKEGDKVEIFRSQNGNDWTSYGFAEVNAHGEVVFAADHLTYYGLTSEGTKNDDGDDGDDTPAGGNGGGGGGSVLVRDFCPKTRDCSSSYYYRLCGPCPTTGDVAVDTGKTITITKVNEQMIAYQYAFLHGITSKTYEEARLEDGITRGEMAKMISQFAKSVLGKTANTKKSCVFEDNIYGSKEDKSYIIQACQLGLMGLGADGKTVNKNFNPSTTLTRAEFGTIFSRLLYGGLYNTEVGSSVDWYANHLSALKNNGVMTKIDTPFNLELRGFVMIMMLRADFQDDGQLTTTPKKVDESGVGEKITNFLEKLF